MGFTRGVSIALAVSTLAVASGLGACATARKVLPHRSAPAANAQAQTGIGVNGYLWRASLDTLSFLPLVTADPWGGVVTYDWYSDPATPNERFKATVYILDARLRADALNVTVNKQVRDASGQWTETQVQPQTETDLENAILTRARQLRLSSAN